MGVIARRSRKVYVGRAPRGMAARAMEGLRRTGGKENEKPELLLGSTGAPARPQAA